jgi:hypothetical protein
MDTKEHAELFYQDLLHADFVKEFNISKSLIKQIFSVNLDQEQISVIVFKAENIIFEIFISKMILQKSFNHVCISVKNLPTFIEECQSMNVPVLKIPKDNKTLIFVKDFSGNLFEIKEK